jgi:rubrerythrin
MNVIEYARETELSGVRFYQEMADRSDTEGVKRIFTMLAHDEELLLEKLQRLQEKNPEMGKQNIRVLNKNNNVFEKLRKQEDKINIGTDVEAYQLACTAEREILRTYEKATEKAEETELKKALIQLTAMEQHELTEIEGMLDFANTPNQSLAWGEFSNIDEFHDFGRYGKF